MALQPLPALESVESALPRMSGELTRPTLPSSSFTSTSTVAFSGAERAPRSASFVHSVQAPPSTRLRARSVSVALT